MNMLNKYIKRFVWFILFIISIFYLLSQESVSFVVEDDNGNYINLSKTNNNYIIICFHYYNCVNCFKIISRLKERYPSYEICVLARVSKNNYNNKIRMKYDVKKILGPLVYDKFKIYFDVHNDEDPWPPINLKDGIFGKYRISKTPSYFILTKDTLIFVPYEQIEKELYK
ncbi:MAG: hypothetical protein CH6_0491 [Candidatus Kapaibacterium sp.]|nr:MAG: hypothetical protein CH6_0491 [Candidatus Kapabacteria bacterium]